VFVQQTFSSATVFTTYPSLTGLSLNPDLHDKRSVTNHLSHGTTVITWFYQNPVWDYYVSLIYSISMNHSQDYTPTFPLFNKVPVWNLCPSAMTVAGGHLQFCSCWCCWMWNCTLSFLLGARKQN